jgi:methyl-accepting chemotaxis protein
MTLNRAELNEYRLHAVTVLTGASAGMSQIDTLAQYSPIAAALAFLIASTSYTKALRRIDDVVDALEDAGVIDEEIADAVEEVVDIIESISEATD